MPLIEEHGVERLDRLPGKRPEVGVGVGRPLPRCARPQRLRARLADHFDQGREPARLAWRQPRFAGNVLGPPVGDSVQPAVGIEQRFPRFGLTAAKL